jgi:hypothetical protein
MPALCSVSGVNVLNGLINIPRIGVWHADFELDSFTTFSGAAVSIQFGSQTMVGTVTRSGSDASKRLRVRIVGGVAGLQTVLPPRSYGSVPLRIPLVDALSGAGETLSGTANPTVLATQLSAWSRMQGGTAGGVVGSLATAAGAAWRVLLDGSVWMGLETWPASSLPDTTLIHSEPEKGRVTVASDAPAVLPGTAFSYTPPGSTQAVRNVSYVRHSIRPDELLTMIYYE